MELTLNLPKKYVEIEEEEMMYLDGGGMAMLSKNLQGFWARTALFRRTLSQLGIGRSFITQVAVMSYWKAVGTFGFAITKTAIAIGGFYAACFGFVGSALAITYLCNKRVFY